MVDEIKALNYEEGVMPVRILEKVICTALVLVITLSASDAGAALNITSGGLLTNNNRLINTPTGLISISGGGFQNNGSLISSGGIEIYDDISLINVAGVSLPKVDLTGSAITFGGNLTLTLDGCDLSGVSFSGGSYVTAVALSNCTVGSGSGFHSTSGAPLPPPGGSPVISGVFIWDDGLAGGTGGWRDLGSFSPMYSVEDLMKIGVDPAWPRSGNYLLMADLDISDIPDWAPIGGTRFTGVFDGNYHTITGLTIAASVDYAGLFAQVGATGEIHRLGLIDANSSSDSSGDAGGLTAYNYGTITECFVSGIVKGYSSGGIAGANEGTIENCYVTADVSNYGGSFSFTGGIAGFNIGSITNCYMSGNITTDITNSNLPWVYAGGIVGDHNDGPVENCFMLGGFVEGGDHCGRIAGNIDTSYSGYFPTVSNVYSWDGTKVYSWDNLYNRTGGVVFTPNTDGRDGNSLSSAETQNQTIWSPFFNGVSPWLWNAASGPPTLSGFGVKNANPEWPF